LESSAFSADGPLVAIPPLPASKIKQNFTYYVKRGRENTRRIKRTPVCLRFAYLYFLASREQDGFRDDARENLADWSTSAGHQQFVFLG